MGLIINSGGFRINGGGVTISPAPTPTTYTVGQAAIGGIIAYIYQPGDPGYDANVQKGLVAATSDQGFASWGCSSTNISTSLNLGSGATNTAAILAGCTDRPIAASIAAAHNGGGYTDWYLPSLYEMDKLWINKSVLGSFPAVDYCTSSQAGNPAFFPPGTTAQYLFVRMINGGQQFYDKTISNGVRAVRSF